ncbi:Comt, partial [Symbiodinium sp. CCMP2456]
DVPTSNKAILSQPPRSWMSGTPPKRSSRLSANVQRKPARADELRPSRSQNSRPSRSEPRRPERGLAASRAAANFSPAEDDGGTGGSHSTTTMATEKAPCVRSTRSPDARQDSFPLLTDEARDWLEENADRLSDQTQKCLMMHQQLQQLLVQQGSLPMRMDAPSARAAREVEEKNPGKLSPTALEGAPLDLKAELCSHSVAARRRDELRSELVAAEQELLAAEAEFRIEEARNDKFEQAVEAGSEAEMRRLQEKAALLEARLRDRLETLQHLASKARAGQQRSPVSLSPTQPCQSPIRSYKIFNTKARSVSPPRQQHSITLSTGKPLVSQCRPLSRTHEPPRALSGSPRAVSTPVVATPPLLRVAAAAAGAARHQATAHFQQLDDARHRAQVDFWSGL